MNRTEPESAGPNRSYYAALLFAGVVALLMPLLLGARQFFQSYFFGWIFWFMLTLGCFGLTLLHHIVRGSWGLVVLRLFEAGNRTLPYMAVLFVPVLFGMSYLYEWTHADAVARDAMLRHKAPYLNVPFWLIRTFLYFAIWIGMATYLNRSSLRQDQTGDIEEQHKRTNMAAPGLVIFIITMTFAVTDWVMSLEPHWFSTIYGFWFLVGGGLFTLAFVSVLTMAWSDRRPFSAVVNPGLMRDLGNLMFVFTMLWAYISLSQFLIIWSANLPEEVIYYQKRFDDGWRSLGGFNIAFQFFVPFLLLLSGRTKRTPRYLLLVASLILFVRVTDMVWIVIPAFHREALNLWADLAAMAGMGALWLAVFSIQLAKYPLLARHEPRPAEGTQEALEHA